MNPLSRSLYRSRQFFGSLRPSLDDSAKAKALAALSPGERDLFDSMMLRDQRHCLDVYQLLLEQGHTDKDLLAAALLHDCGKGRIALWHRVVYVLLDATYPAALDRLARPGDGLVWREALYRCKHHSRLGADLASKAGSSEKTVALIRGDTSSWFEAPLAALEAADDAV
jgi:hypothetical protein